MTITIDYEKCCWKDGRCVSSKCGCKESSCNGCVEACPTEALTREDIVKLDQDKCTNCGACVNACPHDAISMS